MTPYPVATLGVPVRPGRVGLGRAGPVFFYFSFCFLITHPFEGILT